MTSKSKFSIALVVVTLCTWFFFTPYIAVRGMKAAAESKDAAKLADYVNFPALKASLKGSFNAKLASTVTNDKSENPMAAFGAALAAALINPMIDALVTPESLAMLMKGDKPQPSSIAKQSKSQDSDTDTTMSYESFDRFVVTVKKKGSQDAPVGLVFNRDGFASWKLSALRLPL